MEWFAVRSIFKFGEKADGTNIFEERVVGFCAADVDEALHKAEAESQQYAQSSGFEVARGDDGISTGWGRSDRRI